MSYHFAFELPDGIFDQEENTDLDLSPNKDGGVIKRVLKKGEGNFKANQNDKVSVKYTAYLGEIATEYIFDRTGEETPFTFKIGRGKVIRGFELAVMSMRKGEHAIVHLKPEYAYGRGGAPPRIPQNTTIVFDAVMVDSQSEDLSPDKDKSIVKHVLTRGKGYTSPNHGCMVNIHLAGWHDNRQFDNRDLSFPYGEGIAQEYNIPKFVEDLVPRFRMGERAEVIIQSRHAYGAEGCPHFDIPPNADLKYDITMKGYERVKDIWEMDNAEKMDQCDKFREKGTFYYKRQEFKLAKQFYKKMIEYIEHDTCMEGEEEERRKKTLIAGLLNLAMVYLKLEKYPKVRSLCDKVLKMELNAKALFRRGQASLKLKLFNEAKEDFEGVLDMEPDNKAARNQIILCQHQSKKSLGQDQQLAKRMLSNIGKGKDSDLLYDSGMNDITDWDNSMAHGMMTLEQECEAFGDPIPRTGGNNHGIGHEN